MSDRIPIGRYMHAEPVIPDKAWLIRNTRSGDVLATVEWHEPWKRLVLSPDSLAVFSSDCLRVLAVFLDTYQRKADPHA